MDTKVCGTCKVEKPLEAFAKKYDKYTSKCKECQNEYFKEYWKKGNNAQRHRERIKKYKQDNALAIRAKRHGLTGEQLEEMLAKHDGLCWACKERPATAIDHDHTCCAKQRSSGCCIRGLLCMGCNTSLGWMQDSVERLDALREYLVSYRK